MAEKKIINNADETFGKTGKGKATDWLLGYRERERTVAIVLMLATIALVVARCSV